MNTVEVATPPRLSLRDMPAAFKSLRASEQSLALRLLAHPASGGTRCAAEGI
ncbi:MAG: hypothetical protein HYS74_02035 [Parcubacteria group bacterium]|nr:hypothetical protein [Parcubacteria group bacterium]